MKVLILFLFVFSTWSLTAQDSALLKPRYYRIDITQTGDTHTKGWLVDIADSAVVVSDLQFHFRDAAAGPAGLQTVGATQIETFSIKRKNGGARGFGIGLAAGVVAGGLAGLLSGDDNAGWIRFSAGEKALALGGVGGITGGIVGAIIGGIARKTFVIKGSHQKFQEAKLSILDKAYRKG